MIRGEGNLPHNPLSQGGEQVGKPTSSNKEIKVRVKGKDYTIRIKKSVVKIPTR
jgi:hypothetical protein